MSAKAKKLKKEDLKKVPLKETKVAKTKATETSPNTPARPYVFKSRDGKDELKLEKPVEANLASEVLFDVLKQGPVPEGLKLQFAPSYYGHFLNRRGKNACGASKINNLLVVNGIADELEAAGVKGIVKPQPSKSYKAIWLDKMSSEERKDLVKKVANILGFVKSSPKPEKEEKKEEVKSLVPNPKVPSSLAKA